MAIKSVKIENFRCFKNLDISFSQCHTLIGANGVGKTAILEAINIATAPGYAGSRINEEDFNVDDEGNIAIEVEFDKLFQITVPDGYTSHKIPCNKVRLEAKRRERASPGRVLSEPIVVEHSAIPFVYGIKNKPDIYDAPSTLIKTEGAYKLSRKNGSEFVFTDRALQLTNDLTGYPNIFFFDRSREKESKVGFNSLFQRVMKDFAWRYRKNWDQNSTLESWDKYYEGVTSKVIDPKRDAILAPIRELLRQFTGREYKDLEISIMDIEQPFSKGFFSLRRGTNQIHTSSLGSGISILLSFLLLETVAKKNKEEIIILVDEPELHLHPQLQQNLFDHFWAADHQTIYTTQSDSFVNIAKWRSITRIDQSGQKRPCNIKILEQHAGRTVAEHLDDIQRYNQHRTIFYREDSQVFFSTRCLLVEGPNDKYGMPILAKMLEHDLSELTVISCGGKGKIKHYKNLCYAFGIPAFVIFDKDSDIEKNSEENELLATICGDGFFAFSTSFEKILRDGLNISKRNILEGIANLQAGTNIPNEIKNCVEKLANWNNGQS